METERYIVREKIRWRRDPIEWEPLFGFGDPSSPIFMVILKSGQVRMRQNEAEEVLE
jgi:hypothetical protein